MRLTEEQVRDIWARTWRSMKDATKDGATDPEKVKDEPWTGYRDAAKQRRELGPHIENGAFPAHLFIDRAPNQTQAELEWLRRNYKQVTLPVYMDLESCVGRALHPRNWTAEFESDEASDDVREFVNEGIREWGSVFNFMRFAGLRQKLQDAMSVVACLPTEFAVTTNDEGAAILDPDERLNPELLYFTCEQLWGFDYDSWYLVRLNWNTDLRFANTTRNVGVACWLIDDLNVWEILQVGKQADNTFEIRLLFSHGIGFAPVINMMGTPSIKAGRLVWESPYLAVKDILDCALLDEHYLRASKAKCVYPHTVVVGDACEFIDEKAGQRCNGGVITTYGEGGERNDRTCPNCKGTGRRSRLSPFGEVQINPNPDTANADSVNATNALAFISPSTDTVRFMREEFDSQMKQARSIMHLDADAPMAGGDAKTATEAGLNNKSRDAFVKTIADQFFVIHAFLITCVGKLRHGPEWAGFRLTPPTVYDMRTEGDRLAELEAAKAAGLSPSVVSSISREYIESKYAGAPEVVDALTAIDRADRLSTMAEATIAAENAAGRVEPWELLVHYSGLQLADMVDEAKKATTKGFAEAIIELAKAQAPAPVAAGGSDAIKRLAGLVK